MNERIGIAVLCYNSLPDVQAAIASVRAHTAQPYDLVIWDNSDAFHVGTWAVAQEGLTYIRSPYNLGTCCSRNRLAELFIRRGLSHWVVMDQDVLVIGNGWVEDMLALFQKYPDTGIVGWKLGYDQMSPKYAIDPTGVVPETPGLCCMHSADCVRAVGGWEPLCFYDRFEDTGYCFAAGLKGFKTRLIVGEQKVAHASPHRGTGSNPRNDVIKAESHKLFMRRTAELGFPRIHGINA